jgi:predicted ABC-class ATPase
MGYAGRSERGGRRGGSRRTAGELERAIGAIDRRGYPAYKDLRGTYDFGDFLLSVDHVQGDPFAAPSSLSVCMDHGTAGWDRGLFAQPWTRTAFEDFLVRRFDRELSRRSFSVGGSGKSGFLGTSRPGPEVLERTACSCGAEGLTLRFEAGFPAHGRSVAADALVSMLVKLVPAAVRATLACTPELARAARAAADLADDQHFVREELERLGLVAFVADGSVLPRSSGVSSRPLVGAKPFESPASLRTVLDLPHRGPTPGMGVPRGVTLIVGGGYHGKTTLLKALEAGVYNHVAGDGRELAITEADAVKLRAEDGRSVCNVDISPFVNNLPNGADTRSFSTDDASGSTSQAAATVEALAAGSRCLLIDEDTSATNFMVRDALMGEVVARGREPITPFVERARDLYERMGVSSVIVAGSSGAFFYIADTVVQMDCYEPADVTARVAEVVAAHPEGAPRPAPDFAAPRFERSLARGVVPDVRGRDGRGGRGERGGRGSREGRLKVRAHGLDDFEVGGLSCDVRLVEQLADPEQVAALAQMVRWYAEHGLITSCTVDDLVKRLGDLLRDRGLAGVADRAGCGLALPRVQEVYAVLNRLRGV